MRALRVRRPTSLTGRLLLTAVLLVAVVGVLVTVATTLVMREYLTHQLDRQVTDGAQRAQRLVDHDGRGTPGGPGEPDDGGEGGREGGSPSVEFGLGDEVGALLAVHTAGGSTGWVLAPTEGDTGRRLPLTGDELSELSRLAVSSEVQHVGLSDHGSYRVLVQSATIGGDVVTLVSGLPTHDLDRSVFDMLWWQLLLTAAGVAVAGVVGRRLIGRELAPLRRVAHTAHEVAALPLDSGLVGETARVPAELTDPDTEVGQVGSALNTLLGHVEGALDARHRSEQQVRQFVADASHELRTPLATIMGYAELARRSPSYGQDPDQDSDRGWRKVEEEGVRMQALVEDLLLLARLDSGRPLAAEEVDLTKLALEAVEGARVVGPDHGWTLDLPPDPLTVTGDAQRLHQALSNLLANARRHTPAGTTVRVGLRRHRDRVVLTVADDGPGIPAALQSTVFERFTRGDASRTRDSGGAGLGLALVRAIVSAHGGAVSVESGPGATEFTVTLPARSS